MTLVRLEPRLSRYEPSVSGEQLRRRFEERLDARMEELAAELDAAGAGVEAA